MKLAGIGLALLASPVLAEESHLVIGPEQVWVEFIDPIEIMWIGPNEYERTQVLSGTGVEVVEVWSDEDSARLLGARALVAVTEGAHSCENLADPLEYHVVTLGKVLATDGPATSCGELQISLTNDMILAEEDPMRVNTEDGGQSWVWEPGKGFTDAGN